MRECDVLCHDDVIIRLGEDNVIVDYGNVVTRCLNDVILNEAVKLKSSVRPVQFVQTFSSINAYSIHRGISTQQVVKKNGNYKRHSRRDTECKEISYKKYFTPSFFNAFWMNEIWAA